MRRPVSIAILGLFVLSSAGWAQPTETAAPATDATEQTQTTPPKCTMVQGPVMTRRCPSGQAWFERCGSGANLTLKDTNSCVE